MQLEALNEVLQASVEGWVGDRIWSMCAFIQADHERAGITGAIAEIGIHHGRLFLLLAQLARADEDLIAIDLFDDQARNIDRSGSGNLAIFKEHLARHLPDRAHRVRILRQDSMGIGHWNMGSIFSGPVRIFSVDGGHTARHVVNDLSIAQHVLSDRGYVLLDDFMGPHWCGVTEGLIDFMRHHNRRLAPFLIFQNKLFLTTYSDHRFVSLALRQHLDETVGDEIHSGRWRYSELCGHQVMAFV